MSIATSSVFSSVYDALSSFAESDRFFRNLESVFGASYAVAEATRLREEWQRRDFSQLPEIEVIAGSILGNAWGTFAASTNRIYLADDFVAGATPEALLAVVLEEVGHFVDAQVNQLDTPGDEGELFSDGVRGVKVSGAELARIRAEDDHGVIDIGGQSIAIEQAFGTTGYVQFGTSKDDYGIGISTDGNSNVYILGNTSGIFSGNSNLLGSSEHLFIAKYDANGSHLWVKQFASSSYRVSVNGISTDSNGNVYVAGYVYDNSNLGEYGAFVAKYDANGLQLWLKQYGTYSNGISTDNNGNVYTIGITSGNFPGNTNLGKTDAFIAKYDANGSQIWVKQFGTSDNDSTAAISTDSNGYIYVAGSNDGRRTDIILDGGDYKGDYNQFVAKYDANGLQIWVKQFGVSNGDLISGIDVDNNGSIFITGTTSSLPILI